MGKDLSGAELVKRTSQLVAAYCKTLAIEPAELPSLISYVGEVLRTGPKARMGAVPVAKAASWRAAERPGRVPQAAESRFSQPGSPSAKTNLVDLTAHRKKILQGASGRLAP